MPHRGHLPGITPALPATTALYRTLYHNIMLHDMLGLTHKKNNDHNNKHDFEERVKTLKMNTSERKQQDQG